VSAHTAVGYILAFVAAVFASANVVGGYVVTERMLKMFRRKAPEQRAPEMDTALNGHKGLKGILSRAGGKPKS
jgi:NAD(P) transhydrogenase subunit alpha